MNVFKSSPKIQSGIMKKRVTERTEKLLRLHVGRFSYYDLKMEVEKRASRL